MYKNTIFIEQICRGGEEFIFPASTSSHVNIRTHNLFSLYVLTFNLSTPIFKEFKYSMTHDVTIERTLV